MELNKKGIFFTFAAIALSIIIILSFNVYTDYRLNDRMGVIEIRIDTMNNFIKDLENDIENAIFIAGFRSLLSLEEYLMENNAASGAPYNFLDDLGTSLNTAFDEVFREGTITGSSGTERMTIMENNTFVNWTTRMKEQANKTDISLDFNIDSVTIGQTEPWRVDITVQLDITVKDNKNTASWTITDKPYTKKINITSELSGNHKFVDPLYLVYLDGQLNNTIKETTITDFSGAGLVTHLAIPDASMGGSYYRQHSNAPSYLDRFQSSTKFTASANGIESLVNSQKIIDLEVLGKLLPGTSNDKTAVDYIYYDSANNPNKDLIEGMEVLYPWFKLDYSDPTCDPRSGHVLFYDRICDT